MAQRPKNSSHNKKAPNATRAARGPVSWDETVRRFRDHLIGPGEASRLTIDAYSRDLAAFARWWEGARPDQPISPAAILAGDLREWKEFLRAEPLDASGRVRKPASVNAKRACLCSFLAWC